MKVKRRAPKKKTGTRISVWRIFPCFSPCFFFGKAAAVPPFSKSNWFPRYVKEDLIIPHNVSFYELIKAPKIRWIQALMIEGMKNKEKKVDIEWVTCCTYPSIWGITRKRTNSGSSGSRNYMTQLVSNQDFHFFASRFPSRPGPIFLSNCSVFSCQKEVIQKCMQFHLQLVLSGGWPYSSFFLKGERVEVRYLEPLKYITKTHLTWGGIFPWMSRAKPRHCFHHWSVRLSLGEGSRKVRAALPLWCARGFLRGMVACGVLLMDWR